MLMLSQTDFPNAIRITFMRHFAVCNNSKQFIFKSFGVLMNFQRTLNCLSENNTGKGKKKSELWVSW